MPANTNARTDPETTIQRFYEAVGSADATDAENLVTPDWCMDPPVPGLPDGPEGFRQLVARTHTTFADATVSVEEILESGDRVVVRGMIRGTQQGNFFGVPATGRTVEFRACDIHRVEDGRVATTVHLEDHLQALLQLGVTLTPPSA